MLVLKSLVQSQLSNIPAAPSSAPLKGPLHIIARLARRFDEVRHPNARACILWLVGQYAGRPDASPNPPVGAIEGVADWAPDTLRKAAKNFAHEACALAQKVSTLQLTRAQSSVAKLQIVTLAAKLLVLSPAHRTLGLVSRYVFSLARYDMDYDVRDRARTLGSLLAGVASVLRAGMDKEEDATEEQGGVILRRQQVKVVFFEGKAEFPQSEAQPGTPAYRRWPRGQC